MTGIDDFLLSPSQRAVLLDGSRRILVSAGAGSGKTRLLVAYFVHSLIERGVAPQDLVAVTFTRKAAAELASRIRAELVGRGRDDLARALDLSTIGTIHGLCRRLIKEHALGAVVDPAFSIIEAETAAMIKEQVRSHVWTEMVEGAGDVQLAVLATHEVSLRRAIVPVYDRLRAAGQERPRLSVPPPAAPGEAAAELASTIADALAAAAAVARRSATLDKDLCLLDDCLGWLEGVSGAVAAEGVVGSAATVAQAGAAFFPSRKTPAMEESFAPVRAALTSYRTCLTGDEAVAVVEVMNSLLELFHHRYTVAKRERGVLDFADLELRALALIQSRHDEADRLLGPDACVMIDEFQDTNELQCAILENLAPANLLMVGDERQSIYRFRGADVEVFRRREAALEEEGQRWGGGAAAAGGGLHRLADNYRSSRQILGFVNRLFACEHFFGPRFAALERARDEEKQRPTVERAVDVLIVDRVNEGDPEGGTLLIQQAESEAVAWQVRRLIDAEGWEPRDIAVLTPALTQSGILEQALDTRGVDCYLVRGKGYYSREEVSDVRALLQVLINPCHDLALVTVLRSPLVALSDDGLYLLGREARQRGISLWEAAEEVRATGLENEDVRALGATVKMLCSLADRVGRPGLARLIDDAVSEFSYDLRVLASDKGERRFANIRKLMRLAEQYESVHGPDLAGFIEAMEGMGDLSDEEGSAPTLAEGENVVRIMTIHQAKGLEFPVVVLTGLGSEPRATSASQFVLGADGRAAVFLKDTKRKPYEQHDLCWGPGVEIMQEEKAQEQQEDLRLLYVAMTRAEDRLVLVGARPRSDDLAASRIGRIVAGLGLDSIPQRGEGVRLEGIDAAVWGVSPSMLPAETENEALCLPRGHPVRTGEPEAAAPQFLEAGSPHVLPRRISFSGLAAFRRCPRRFYLERLLGTDLGRAGWPGTQRRLEGGEAEVEELIEDHDVWLDEGEINIGRDTGLLVHALLERLPLSQPPPDIEHLRRMASEITASGDAPLSPTQLERAARLTEAFWRAPVSSRGGLAGADKEVAFCFAERGTIISGVMDLVWREGDSWFIVDYKTNSLEGRDPVEMASAYDLQSCVYSLAALRAGAGEVSMEFLFLEQPETTVRHTFSSDDAARLERRLDDALAEIRRGDFPPAQGDDCGACPLDEVCAGLR